MIDKYHVAGCVVLNVHVDCLVEAESLRQAKEIVADNIENGYLEDYELKIYSCDLESNLLEDE